MHLPRIHPAAVRAGRIARATALSLIASVALFSCGEGVSPLPTSMGGFDEVVFVKDARYLEDTIYKLAMAELESHFGAFPFHEPRLDVIDLELAKLDDMFTHHRNMIFIGTIDRGSDYADYLMRLLGDSGIEKVRSGGAFNFERRNVWADGQFVHGIVAEDPETLLASLPKAIDKVVARIHETEFEKIRKFVYLNGTNAEAQRILEAESIGIKIPSAFKRHKSSTGNFHWYRKSTLDLTSSIMIYHHPYRRTVETTPDYAIFLRDSLGKRYERSRIQGAYMTTEKLVRPIIDTVTVDGNFAIRTEGLWRLEHDFMGGPFVNYLVYDDAQSRIVFVEAYLYNPDARRGGRRRAIREMDAMLTTLRLPDAAASADS